MTMRKKKWHIEDAIPNLEKAAFIRIFKSQIRFNTTVLFYMIQPMHFFTENIQIETVFLALFNLNQYDINGE
jgi:hypothetical protein